MGMEACLCVYEEDAFLEIWKISGLVRDRGGGSGVREVWGIKCSLKEDNVELTVSIRLAEVRRIKEGLSAC